MGKILVVAEKPSVARDYGRVLKCPKKGNGYLEGENYVITWAIGHLVSLAEPHHYDKRFKTWRQEDLPIQPSPMKLRVDRSKSSQFNTIKKFMKDPNIDYIICGTDSGREGELIFRYIYDHAGCKKEVKRLWISSMTDEAISAGFEQMKDMAQYDGLYASAKCRSEADWLVGMNGSRSFSIQYSSLLSIGRVQTPTLAIIAKRYLEIENFKPEDYYELEADFGVYKGMWINGKKSSKIKDYDKATELMQKIHKQIGEVESCKKQEKKTPPPLPYDLTELQREANKRFGYSANKTLQIAQNLYEKLKLITYPRTDSRYITKDLKGIFIKRVQRLNIEPYKPFVERIQDFSIKRKIVNDAKVTDHHAIIITDRQPDVRRLSNEDFNIYNLIVVRMLELFYPNYVEEKTDILTRVNGEAFITKGKRIVDKGYVVLAESLLKQKNKKEELLPEVHKGDQYPVENSKILKKKTKPPKLYTEATLLSAMEQAGRFVEDEALKEKLKESGLGTPATRASVIERLIRVDYITRKGKNLIPTEKGLNLIRVVPEELKSPEMTGKWERGLHRIQEGTMDPQRFMQSINRYVYYIVNFAREQKENVTFPKLQSKKSKNKGLGVCPLCKTGKIYENKKAFFCGSWKDGCGYTTWKNQLEKYGIPIDAELIKVLLKDGVVKDCNFYLPQTQEKCVGNIKLHAQGHIEIEQLKRT